ncbi:MAG: MBL fold metallo-hydrolase, partial [Candidatus Cloacimonetes bacterium]|nr:MBL fold metallo-hydrolase [Candidatus Cloacimonadota bacterium]
MNIRILGSASGLPTPGKNHSAVYVHSNDSNILFDCGEGTAKQLLRYKLDHNHLDAIVISHFHPDHISGLYMVLQMLYL